ncbi:MAG: hypothetical protein HBSAPP04_25800 [Ignavibacteriaceae bacterium]|nr:MAG: hypothetical protein EDM75_10985 [Chlorobiota bacterium]GJQ33741.1 MAG: hypothetical protein HBSAPP04_25800 [Ignavibacteriaceae bacterium]
MNRDEVIARIVESIRRSGKYSNVYEGTIIRIARMMAERFGKEKEIEKNAKKKLHQMYGAYFGDGVKGLGEKGWSDERIQFILTSHVSTAERMGFYSEFYDRIFAELGPPEKRFRIYDAACGYNPFSAGIFKERIELYRCSDIDVVLNEALNGFFAASGLDNFQSENRDLLSEPFDAGQFDAVFLFKTLSCIERQEKGSAKKILDQALKAAFVVVSFPLKSIGGREKGMEENYTGFVEAITMNRVIRKVTLNFPNEIVFILGKE